MTNHLLQSTLFTAIAWLLTLALRTNRARVRHAVWLAASCKFLVPLSLLVALGGQVSWRTPPVGSHTIVIDERLAAPFFSPAAVYQAAPPESLLPAVFWSLWACGFAGIACSWLVRWKRIRSVVRAASPVRADLPIPALLSPSLLEPGVFGAFRPVLLLPESVYRTLAPAQLQAVFAHELCHVRHRDNLVAALHMFVETVFWFHPLVWWIGKRMVEEREHACDEEVLSLGSEPKVYAEGILRICRLCVESPLACISGVTGSNLERRIQTILRNRTARALSLPQKAALALTALVTLTAPVAVGVLNAPPMRAQSTASTAPKFEVTSVKPCKDQAGRMRASGESSPGRLATGCSVLVDENYLGLIQRAYVRFAGGHANPLGVVAIKGGPDWIHSQPYEINARAEGHPGTEMMQGPMLQALLEDRFKLKIHRETREGAVYTLTVAKDVSKLKPFREGSCIQAPPAFPFPALPAGQRYCKAMIMLQPKAVNAEGSTLLEFSKLLNLVLDRPVIDQTGLSSRFDIHLEFSPDDSTPGARGPAPPPLPDAPPAAADPAGPNIFAAIQEQLGLKLTPAKGPIEILVIDHIEKPSGN